MLCVVALFEGSELLLDLSEVGEVVGVDDLALHDLELPNGEVDLHLVQPGSMHWGANQHRVREGGRQAVGNRSAAFLPRWEEPLSTIQNTRFALA